MLEISSLNPQKLRELVLNASQPIVLRNVSLDWDIAGGSLEDWCSAYDKEVNNEPAKFARMPRKNGSTPQHENSREYVQMETTKILSQYAGNKDSWMALNYKYTFEVPPQCQRGVQFDCFGFPRGRKDCTYWLGSQGSNTPCHYDSYGCNVVVQVFGRKSWLLFPPDAPLQSTRIPYEESSVYSQENFYSPNPRTARRDFEHLEKYAHHCVLEANSVLIVPRHWWHFVEALSPSLSVNYWVPLQSDWMDQMDECLVQKVIGDFLRANDDGGEIARSIVQNVDANFQSLGSTFTEEILCTLINQPPDSTKHPSQTLTEREFAALLRELPNTQPIPRMGEEKFRQLIDENAKRYDAAYELPPLPLQLTQMVYLNSLCSPAVVKSFREEFCKRFPK